MCLLERLFCLYYLEYFKLVGIWGYSRGQGTSLVLTTYLKHIGIDHPIDRLIPAAKFADLAEDGAGWLLDLAAGLEPMVDDIRVNPRYGEF